MLKITSNDDDGVRTFKLEGKLAGEWVNELRNCWQRELLNGEGKPLRLDLAGVTWVNEEGKALLGAIYRQGAELLSANLLMAALLAEIYAEASD